MKFIKKHMERRTIIFILFMTVFFGITLYLTYYSRVVYIKNLPRVHSVMPERTDVITNGRTAYIIPATAVHIDDMNKRYILTARYFSDIIGERYLAIRVDVWVLKQLDDERVLIDGIVREEEVLVGTENLIKVGQAVFPVGKDLLDSP